MNENEKEAFHPDPMRFDFARRDVRELVGLLTQEVYTRRQIIDTLESAGIQPGTITLDQAPRWIWTDALKAAGAAGRLRLLLSRMLEDEAYSFAHTHLRRLLAGEPVPVAPRPPAGNDLRTDRWHGGREAQTAARSGLVDIGFLVKGLRAARSVLRITVNTEDGPSHGTGFLVGPNRVLTNHHVLFDDRGRPGRDVVLHADFELGPDGRQHTGRAIHGVDASIRGDAALDWAVIDLAETLDDTPVLELSGAAPQKGDYVSIIQHPFGGLKKIALFHNEVRFVDDTFVQYLTDTEAGSSGSPVLNTRWEVVALHHAWVAAADERLQVRNEGVLIGPIAAALRAQGLLAP